MNVLKEVLKYLPKSIADIINNIDKKYEINEIRLRKNKSIVLVIGSKSLFIDSLGNLKSSPYNCLYISSKEFEDTFFKMCDYSFYTHESTLINGYITLSCGARVGVSSTAVIEKHEIKTIKDVISLNIRIPCQNNNCSYHILDRLYKEDLKSLIVVGKPSSGKTTLLRDMAYNLSNGFNGKYVKTVLIDERNEFAGKTNDEYTLSVGENCDVLTGFKKSIGIDIAIRTLSPQLIVCDEISTIDEINSIKFGFSSGVSFVLSMHIGCFDDIFLKNELKMLLDTKSFSHIILLKDMDYKYEIISVADIYNEISRNSVDCI